MTKLISFILIFYRHVQNKSLKLRNVRTAPFLFTWFLFCCLPMAPLLSPLNAENSTAPEELWNKALALQQESKFEQAAEAWHSVLQDVRSHKEALSGAHWNLGLCCLKLQLPNCSAFHWLESIRQSTSYAHNMQVLQALSQLQLSIGLSSAATASSDFWLATQLGENTTAVCLSLALWCLLAGLIALGRARKIPRIGWFGFSLGLGCCTLGSWYFSQQLPLYRAVGIESAEVPIYASEQTPNAIATLPAGTVVKIGVKLNGRFQIHSPLPGWIPENTLAVPFSGQTDSLRGAKHSAAR